MPQVRVHNFVVSLDGYATGDGQSLQAAFGDAQQVFMEWFEKLRIWRGLAPDGKFGPAESIAAAWEPGIGAEIMGRNKFRPGTGPWPDDGWIGWWGEEPVFRTPCFVMTHHLRPSIVAGQTTYHFVKATPARVLSLAQEAAGGLDVRIGGGPSTVNAFLRDDLIDYLHVVVIPVVLGHGVPLWPGLGGLHDRFDIETVTLRSGATHLFATRTSR
jgi:dihydrofolate reductase